MDYIRNGYKKDCYRSLQNPKILTWNFPIINAVNTGVYYTIYLDMSCKSKYLEAR